MLNYDQTNGNSYDQIATVRNTSRQITNVVTTLDDTSVTSTFYDIDGSQTCLSSTSTRDIFGAVDVTDITYNDDGTRVVTNYDQDNVHSWTQNIITYDANGDIMTDIFI